MRLFDRLKDLLASERGNVLAVGAATLPLLMGSAGFAIDSIQMAMWKRQLQRAADSAAIAGVQALKQGASTDTAVANDIDEHIDYDLEENETPMLDGAPVVIPGSFAEGEMSRELSCAERGAELCYDRAVEVTLAATRTLPFMSLFTRSSTRLTATATAALVPEGDFCLISLYDGTETGIRTGGNSDLALGCGMTTNSRGTGSHPAFRNYGNATVIADPVGAVGSIGGNSEFAKGTTLLPFTAPVTDPFDDVSDVGVPNGEACNTVLSVAKDTTRKLDPATGPTCFNGWNVNGTVELAPGTYYVKDAPLNISGRVTGTDVTIVLLGDASDLVQSGGGTLAIDAPESGAFEGIALYRSRDAAVREIKLNGGAAAAIRGAIYMPSTDFTVNGNTQIVSTCLQVVARKIHFSGGGNISNTCSNQSVRSIKYEIIRMVA